MIKFDPIFDDLPGEEEDEDDLPLPKGGIKCNQKKEKLASS